jgi:hypothetical protein
LILFALLVEMTEVVEKLFAGIGINPDIQPSFISPFRLGLPAAVALMSGRLFVGDRRFGGGRGF